MSGLELPRFVPEPPAPVYQVSVAPPPATPLAVSVVVALAHMEVIPPVAVISVIAGKAVPVPFKNLSCETVAFAVEVATVIFPVLVPLFVGVNITLNVAVPPPPVTVAGIFDTANSALSDVMLEIVAVPPLLVIV